MAGGQGYSRFGVTNNAYYDGSNYRYVSTAEATLYGSSSGSHLWFNAPSGTAGNAITFTQAMTLDASGRLGIGTSSPGAKLDVNGDVRIGSQLLTGTGVSTGDASIELGNFRTGNGNSYIDFHSAASTDFEARIIRLSGANGNFEITNSGTGALIFSTGSSPTERARITSDGNFLVGKTSTADTVVGGLIGATGYISSVRSSSSNTDTTLVAYSTGASAYRFYVGMGGTVYATSTTISAISDQRLKENIQDLDVGLDKIMALKPRKFDWKPGKGKDKKGDRGWIAQEFEQVFPEMIDTWRDPAPEGEEPYKAVNADLIPILVKAIQELKTELDSVKAELAALKGA
jgi:hypothetical protein